MTFNAAAPANAAEILTGDITDTCTANCVDTWKVDCKNGNTHEVRAYVKDPLTPHSLLQIINTGYLGPKTLVGQADVERTEGLDLYSRVAQVTRTGTTHGSTKTMVLVSAYGPTPYTLSLSCHDINGAELANPVVTPLQE